MVIVLLDLIFPSVFLLRFGDESDDKTISVLSIPLDFFKGVRKSYIFGEI